MDQAHFRYMEYCITAPLLFLAVLCLLTVDAPAWLFLTGYWLIQACNAVGIAFHYSVCFDIYIDTITAKPEEGVEATTASSAAKRAQRAASSFLVWVKGLIIDGSWADKWGHWFSMLNDAWLCLLVPIGGIVYMCRDWLLHLTSGEMPWLALVMIWQLLLTYCLFGIIPTFIYLSGRRDWIQAMPWWLDVLNLTAKWPVPIFILIAFASRPAGFRPCA